MQQPTFVPHPRVRFTDPEEFFDRDRKLYEEKEKEPRLVVALPKDAVVPPKLILKPPKHVVESRINTIASRVKARQQMEGSPQLEGSIVDRVA